MTSELSGVSRTGAGMMLENQTAGASLIPAKPQPLVTDELSLALDFPDSPHAGDTATPSEARRATKQLFFSNVYGGIQRPSHLRTSSEASFSSVAEGATPAFTAHTAFAHEPLPTVRKQDADAIVVSFNKNTDFTALVKGRCLAIEAGDISLQFICSKIVEKIAELSQDELSVLNWMAVKLTNIWEADQLFISQNHPLKREIMFLVVQHELIDGIKQLAAKIGALKTN